MYNREYRTERGMRYADGDAYLKVCPKYYVSFGLKLMDFQYEFLSEELTKYENLVRDVLTFIRKIRAYFPVWLTAQVPALTLPIMSAAQRMDCAAH